MIKPAFEILNQRGTPMFFSDIFANRPNAGIVGRIFISTDTFAFYRDNGVTWDLIGGPGTGTITGSGTAFKYPVFSNTQEISDGSIEQFTNENKSTKDFFIETSTSGGFNETTLKLTNVYFGNPDSFTFKYGRTILAGNPFLEMRSNSALFPTSRTLFFDAYVDYQDQYIVVENSISNQVGVLTAVEPDLSIQATGSTNRAILTLAPSVGNYAGTIRTGSALNTLEFQTGSPVTTRLTISATGTTTISDLAGTGTRMVVADSTGLLSTQATPTIFGSLAANQVAYGTATNTIGGSNNLYFDNTNIQLGLGTITPNTGGYAGSILGIYGTGNTGGNIWMTSDTTTTLNRAGRIGFGTEGNTTNKEIARFVGLADGSTAGNFGGRFQFLTKPDNAAGLIQRLVITQNGAIGVGSNTSPNYALDVRNTINTVAINATSSTANDILYYASGTLTGSIYPFLASINATSTINAVFENTNTASGSSSVSIVVNQNSTGDPYLGLTTSGATNWSIGVDNSDSDKLKIGAVTNPSSGSTTITADTSGSVGIGTSTYNDNLYAQRMVIAGVPSSSNGGGLFITNNQATAGQNAFLAVGNFGSTDGTKVKPSLYLNNYITTSTGVSVNSQNSMLGQLSVVAAANLNITNISNHINLIDINNTSGEYINYNAYLYAQRNSLTTNVNSYTGFYSRYQTAISNETITNLYDFRVSTGSLSAGSLVTNRYGLFLEHTNTQVTNAWGIYQTSSAVRNYLNGNLQLGSTTAFAGAEKLQVTGNARITGTTELSGNLTTFNGFTIINNGSANWSGAQTTQSAAILNVTNTTSSSRLTAGVQDFVSLTNTFAPTSGPALHQFLSINCTINQTGGANGITRGLYVNSTITAAADWRSIETNNNSGYAAYFGGSADLYIGDAADIQLGTTTGTKLGTATSQKLAFWNATPIVQPTTAVGSATFASPGAGTSIKTDDTFDGYTLQQVVKALRDLGILA